MSVTAPARLLVVALLLVIAALAAVILLAVRQPWLGATLVADPATGTVMLTALPSRDAPPALPARLVALASPAQPPLMVRAADLVEEPDTLGSRAAMDAFFGRQGRLQERLAGEALQLVVQSPGGEVRVVTVAPAAQRPLASLPPAFWVQLGTGAGSFLIGCWVLALRPRDAAVRCLAVSGAGLMVAVFAPAIYSTRELALAEGFFRTLSALNHLGTAVFIGALLALFLLFPRRLVRPRWLWAIPAVSLPWMLLDSLGVLSPVMGGYLPILLQTLGLMGLIAWQWRVNRGHPAELAALRWLGLATVLTVSLLLMAVILPELLDQPPLLSQGYAIGFFLILYAGLAIGVSRQRLFDLDRWAFHLLLWVGGAAVLMLLDLALFLLLHLNPSVSLLLALALSAFLWLPLRGWLWRRLVERRTLPSREVFRRVLEVALAPSEEASRERWIALIHDLFAPLRVTPLPTEAVSSQAERPSVSILQAAPPAAAPPQSVRSPAAPPEIDADGLCLRLPATGRVPALALEYAEHGRRLFSASDVARAEEVLEMLRHADAGRDAYSEGAREERRRIARDLHDDVGSRLLSSLHQPALEGTRLTIRDAIADMRTIISGLSGEDMTLDVLLADLRHETARRLSTAGIELEWPPSPEVGSVTLDYAFYRNYASILRELVSNVLRHSGAAHVRIGTRLDEGGLWTTVGDDGVGLPATREGGGHGLANLQHRIAQQGGQLRFDVPPEGRGTCVVYCVPLSTPAERPGEDKGSASR